MKWIFLLTTLAFIYLTWDCIRRIQLGWHNSLLPLRQRRIAAVTLVSFGVLATIGNAIVFILLIKREK